MPKNITEQSQFDQNVSVPQAGDRDYAPVVESAIQKLANRTLWLKDNQLVGPEGPAGPQGPTGLQGLQGPAGNDGVDGVDGFSSINGVTNPGGSINIIAGPNIVITDNGVDSITIAGTQSTSADLNYINETPTTSTIGGIPAGTTFPSSNPKTIQEVLDMLLYPYQSPAFTSFSISSLGGASAVGNTLEVGDSISSNRTFTWGTSNSSNINANSISIIDQTNATTIVSGLSNDGTESVTYGSITKTSATSHVFRVEGTDTQSSTFSSTYTVNWRHKRWWGTDPNASFVSANILGLDNSEFSTSRAKSFTIDGNGEYIYYAYPAAWGTATFTVNGFLNTAWTLTVINHTNSSGHVESYNVYRTNTIQNGTGIQIVVS
jgi:hypothetical protein